LTSSKFLYQEHLLKPIRNPRKRIHCYFFTEQADGLAVLRASYSFYRFFLNILTLLLFLN